MIAGELPRWIAESDPMKTLAYLLTAVVVAVGAASAQAPPAPLLPTTTDNYLPAPQYDPAPEYQSRPTLELPAAPISDPVLTPSYPQPYATPSYQRPYVQDNTVGPSYVLPQPIGPVPHHAGYGPAPVVTGPHTRHAPAYGHGDRYVSPPVIELPGPRHTHRVRYKDRENTHPHSIRQTLFVPSRCGCGEIAVDVCAPPGCPIIKTKRRGKKIEYDYGDYEVDIIQKDGEILVDYDD